MYVIIAEFADALKYCWPWFHMGQTVARHLHELMSGGQPNANATRTPSVLGGKAKHRIISDPFAQSLCLVS